MTDIEQKTVATIEARIAEATAKLAEISALIKSRGIEGREMLTWRRVSHDPIHQASYELKCCNELLQRTFTQLDSTLPAT